MILKCTKINNYYRLGFCGIRNSQGRGKRYQPRLITLFKTLVIPDITKTDPNYNCFIVHYFEENNDTHCRKKHSLISACSSCRLVSLSTILKTVKRIQIPIFRIKGVNCCS